MPTPTSTHPPALPRHVPEPARMLLGCLLLAAVAGCASPPGPAVAGASLQPAGAAWAYRQEAGSAPALDQEGLPAAWWQLFGDPVLTRLQADAASGSLDLQAALLRLAESRARLGLSRVATQPQLDAGGDLTRAGISADSPLAALGAPTSAYNQWQLGLQASWELDLWGHQQQLTSAALSQLQATQWAAQAARVSLGAEVARHYLMLRGVQAQQRLLAEHHGIAAELLRLTESRERHGVATRFDAAAARAELATVQARRLQLEHQRDALANQLALLAGKAPHELDQTLLAGTALPPLPSRLPVGVPSELARRRPDILKAEAELRAATAEVGAAQADFYPRVRLSAALGLAAFRVGELDSWDARQFSAGPAVHLPLFDGGRLKQTLALTQARQQSAALAWRHTVLRAWHEVTDALDSLASDHARQTRLAQAAGHQAEALDAARNAWKAGSADFTTVLVAQRKLLEAQGALADNATATGLGVVALYRALGGGWSPNLAGDGEVQAQAPAVVAQRGQP